MEVKSIMFLRSCCFWFVGITEFAGVCNADCVCDDGSCDGGGCDDGVVSIGIVGNGVGVSLLEGDSWPRVLGQDFNISFFIIPELERVIVHDFLEY
ncbi:Hypothetical predicted protein [Octopus vulgaris]|uniref:Secreted protein n=1 Tax=Octopus vulgaris TaxID=6645 RepID=A0AA36AQJ9_OCTVU|nr:Hypothetical predicted protein [Octopus vulgaris]